MRQLENGAVYQQTSCLMHLALKGRDILARGIAPGHKDVSYFVRAALKGRNWVGVEEIEGI